MNCASKYKKGFGAKCDKCYFANICPISVMFILTQICDIFLLLNIDVQKIVFSFLMQRIFFIQSHLPLILTYHTYMFCPKNYISCYDLIFNIICF